MPRSVIGWIAWRWWKFTARVTREETIAGPDAPRPAVPQPVELVAVFANDDRTWTAIFDLAGPEHWIVVDVSFLGITDARQVSRVLANAHSPHGRVEFADLPRSIRMSLNAWRSARELRSA
jgi:hypothetical protein